MTPEQITMTGAAPVAAIGRSAGFPDKVDLGVATLTDLGITRDQSSEWQKLAEIPDDVHIPSEGARTHLDAVSRWLHLSPLSVRRFAT